MLRGAECGRRSLREFVIASRAVWMSRGPLGPLVSVPPPIGVLPIATPPGFPDSRQHARAFEFGGGFRMGEGGCLSHPSLPGRLRFGAGGISAVARLVEI